MDVADFDAVAGGNDVIGQAVKAVALLDFRPHASGDEYGIGGDEKGGSVLAHGVDAVACNLHTLGREVNLHLIRRRPVLVEVRGFKAELVVQEMKLSVCHLSRMLTSSAMRVPVISRSDSCLPKVPK